MIGDKEKRFQGKGKDPSAVQSHLEEYLKTDGFTVQTSSRSEQGVVIHDELDRELERRGHRYVRYADDCNIYVRSERAGQRVMKSITKFITQKLKLKVNESKSAVARPQERKFLGFTFTDGPEVKRAIAPKSLVRFKRRVRRSHDVQRASAWKRRWRN